eukprot:TRINITY_DN105157_c0_g1_i1.p1 TRINITY_DN105157_c0_g1~~TRINITY_DN105157_c0_g1_i1.p1  ORF type:complete len:370 (-),score=68.60 TRINITY_DN105157_c0_g1_i1:78-1187(-)
MDNGPEFCVSAAMRLASKAPSCSSSSEASTALESPGDKLRTTPSASADDFRPSTSDAGSLSDAASSSASGERIGGGAAELPLRLPLSRRQAWCDVEDDFEQQPSAAARPEGPRNQQCSPPSRRNLLRYDRRRRQREDKRQSPSLLTQEVSRRSWTKQQPELGALPLTPAPPPPPDYSPKLAAVGNGREGLLPPASEASTQEGVRQPPIIMSTSPVAARTPQHLPAARLGFFPHAPGAASHFQGAGAGWSLSAALGIADNRPPPPPPPPFAPTATTPSNSSVACGALAFQCGQPSFSAPQAHPGTADASSRHAAFPLNWPSSGLTAGAVQPAAAGTRRCTLEALLTPVGSSDRAQLAERLLAAAPESYED